MYMFFDTETSDLPKDRKIKDPRVFNNFPHLVQLGFLTYDENKNITKTYNQIIKPDNFIISEGSANVHKITQEYAIENGIPLNDALNDFFDAVENVQFLIAHNVEFDLQVIYAECFRNKFKRKLKNKPIKICTIKTTTNFCKIKSDWKNSYKWPKLSELHTILFNENFEGAHDALNDVKATAKCFFECVNRGIIVPNDPKYHYKTPFD